MIPVQPSLPPFGGAGDEGRWSSQETRDLIEIRAQLEWAFTEANMNINLWELVAERIREKGYWRTADQCKCKWESLVIGYEVVMFLLSLLIAYACISCFVMVSSILFLFFYLSALWDLNDKIDLLVGFVFVIPLNKWHFYLELVPHGTLGNQFPELSICES